MSDIPGTTRAQTKFLRSLRANPFGPNVADWPSVAILRRWLRRPTFVQAMKSVQVALRWQADFQLLSSAAAAAHVMHTSVTAGGDNDEQNRKQIKAMADVLKMAHVRERFAGEQLSLPNAPADPPGVLATLRKFPPDWKLGFALTVATEGLKPAVEEEKLAKGRKAA